MKILFTILVIGVLLGWLCPVKGPFDTPYKEPEVKRPHRGVSAPAPKKTEIYEDYNEDGEPEWYQLVPMFEIE